MLRPTVLFFPPRPALGFTLLEVLIILSILGFLTAMLLPSVGLLDDMERERRTRARMDQIRAAILGPEGRFDAQGRPIIGGYVGDMRDWPDLWEARAEIKPSVTGDWFNLARSGNKVGQGPKYEMDPDLVFFRPSGNFTGKRWAWNRPFRKLSDDNATNKDHIGGLETENEGQPRGLWTRFVEDLPRDLGTHKAPGEVLDDRWKGPYLTPPQETKPADSGHLAETDKDYAELLPTWLGTRETWEDGDYDPRTGEPGELYDDKERFRLMQTQGRLADGWDRAFRFFISADPDHSGGTIFWIISEGPDREAVYPNKGGNADHGHDSWIVNAGNTMARAYDEDHPLNKDNLVMKLHSRDWEGIFAAQDLDRTRHTEALLADIRQALVGELPMGPNTGYTGDMAAWPLLFHWDDSAEQWAEGTIGQPRGLWTDRPGPGHELNATRFGPGWRHAYLGAPHGTESNNTLRDAWDRPMLFFHDQAADQFLILSRGADGKYDFGQTKDDNKTEPANYIQSVNAGDYNASLPENLDNRHLLLRGQDWRQGWFRLETFTILNVNASDTIRARFFASGGSSVSEADVLLDISNAGNLTDTNDDGEPDAWICGNASLAFDYMPPASNATTGLRALVFWKGNNDVPDTGEMGRVFWVPVGATLRDDFPKELILDANSTDDFQPIP